MEKPNLAEITLITLCGGILGILFMVPLRKALIVKEHNTLPYPEGTACAEVLLAGERGEVHGNEGLDGITKGGVTEKSQAGGAASVFTGMGFAAAVKLIIDGLKIIPSTITLRLNALKTEVSTEVYPALIGVGYICGPKIAAYMLAGGVLGWLVLIPAIGTFGGNSILFPGTVSVEEIYAVSGAGGIWNNYIRYIGAGAVAAGGIISLVKTLPLIVSTFREAVTGMTIKQEIHVSRTERDLDIKVIFSGWVLMVLAIWLLPVIPVNFTGAAIIVIFGFFFAAVSSRMVGLVGSSNNPVSGMAIATLLLAAFVLKLSGEAGSLGMQGAIAIGSVICIVACMAGDTSQDLKTGFLLGATPKKQQIGEMIGTVFSALAIGAVLYLLDAAWGFGSEELSAPQATLMKIIVEGVMEGNLPWALVFIGVFVAAAVELLGVPVLPVAIGLYLPLALNACIMVGGLVRMILEKMGKAAVSRGILFSSGMIAGEGLAGILLAVSAVAGVEKWLNMSDTFHTGFAGGILVLAAVVFGLLWTARTEKRL